MKLYRYCVPFWFMLVNIFLPSLHMLSEEIQVSLVYDSLMVYPPLVF